VRGRYEVLSGFWRGNLKRRDLLERIILLKWILRKLGWKGEDQIVLSQDRGR